MCNRILPVKYSVDHPRKFVVPDGTNGSFTSQDKPCKVEDVDVQ